MVRIDGNASTPGQSPALDFWTGTVFLTCLGLSVLLAVPMQSEFSGSFLEYCSLGPGNRPFELRLAGPWPYAPYRDGARRDRFTLRTLKDPRIRREIALEDRIRREGERGDQGALLSKVLLDLTRKPPGAVEELEGLLAGTPPASLLVQIGVAYWREAASSDDPLPLYQALQYTDRALAASQRGPEAVFNLAVILERLHLPEKAAEAWERYLRLDSTTLWAGEARRRRQALRAAADSPPPEIRGGRSSDDFLEAARSRPREVRLEVETLLGAWARHRGTQPRQALDWLEEAARLGRALESAGGDPLPLQSSLAALQAVRSGEHLTVLVDGHQRLQQGWDEYRERRYQAALPHFRSAQRGLEAAGTPAVLLAGYGLALSHYQSAQSEECLRLLAELLPRSEAYPSLRGDLHKLRGLVAALRGDLGTYLHHSRGAAEAFESAGEDDRLAIARNDLATAWRLLGQAEKARTEAFRALAQTPTLTPANRFLVYGTLVDQLDWQGLHSVSRYFCDGMVESARRDIPSSLPHALRIRAANLEMLREREAAREDLRAARLEGERISDPTSRNRVLADLLEAEARLTISEDPRRSARLLEEAARLHRSLGSDLRLPGVFFWQSVTQLRQGHLEAAQAALETAIGALEQTRRRLTENPMQVAFVDSRFEAYESMITVQLAQRRPELALGYGELVKPPPGRRCRAEVQEGPLSGLVSRVQRVLPPGTLFLEYLLLEDRVLTWAIEPSGVTFLDREESRLGRELGRLREGAGGPDAALLSRLHDALVEPVRPALTGKRRVVIAPDKDLWAVPFAALLDRRSGRHLVEDQEIVVVPGARWYLDSVRCPRPGPNGPPRSVLAVGNPAFDRALFPELPRLPEADRETSEIAALYPKARLLRDSEATPESVLSAAQDSEVVHLAVHALASQRSPYLSQLMLADAPGVSGLLSGGEIARLRLDRTRLVVLSACRTGGPGESLTGGGGNLAVPFLEAGVPAVVVTLWPVADDAATVGLLVDFHRLLQAGGDAVASLRGAQLQQIRSRPGEPVWAAFQLVATPDSGERRTE